MPINLSILDLAVEKNIRPCLIQDGHLQNPKTEGYHHLKVIPKVRPLLSREALERDARGSLETAVKSSVNLLDKFEVTAATNFLKDADPEAVRDKVIDLLFGTQSVRERLQSFREWANVPENSVDGNKSGINLTVASFLLAMSDPKTHAFCKPNIYKAAAKALLARDDEGNSPDRLINTAELYREALKLFQERYGLPFSDLHHAHIAFYLLAKPYEGYPGWSGLNSNKISNGELSAMHDLNVILYGPPGTGKTYDTIRRAVEICDGTIPPSRADLVKRFNDLQKENRIAFVTFHQAYGYEDFIEGLRPVLGESEPTTRSGGAKDIQYECRPGIFKRLCNFAGVGASAKHGVANGNWNEGSVWKMSLGDSNDPNDAGIYEDCIAKNVIRMGYGGDIDFTNCQNRQDILKKLQEVDSSLTSTSFDVRAVEALRFGMEERDLVVISDGNYRFRAIARITGPYQLLDTDNYRQARRVEWIVQFKESLPIDLIYNKKLSQMTIYRFRDDELRREAIGQLLAPAPTTPRNFVLIIDEINRGNITKILGELITLLEPDKRIGAENHIPVTLPYSGESFGVPPNVFVIGTMNTADRSIAFLDVALRRRFKFVEVMPEYQLLQDRWKQNGGNEGVSPAELLKVINARIEFIYDRDHQIGHSFFLDAKSLLDLRDVFCGKVIPLLQEYFYGDWAKVCLVLGCPVNSESSKLQANPCPVVEARSLKKESRLGPSDEFDDKLSFRVSPTFANSKSAGELEPVFAAMLTAAKAV